MSRTQITVNPNHPHGNMPGWEAEGVDLETMLLIKRMVLANHMDSPDYKAKQGSGVFLQGYHEPDDHSKGWIFLEFWQRDYQRFVDHANAELLKEENYDMIRQIYPERFETPAFDAVECMRDAEARTTARAKRNGSPIDNEDGEIP